jgi:sulfite reductase (NADPH) flavoprotein alpha-component
MIPVLPDSAPFTPAQRAWLNGFFAGLLNLEPASPVAAGSRAAARDAPTIPGESRSFLSGEPVGAPLVGAQGGETERSEEELPWHDPTLPMDERLALAAGRPQEQVLMAAMAQLDCGSCGYLCQSYAEAIARGEETELTRCVPGGSETARKLKELVRASGGRTQGSPLPPPAKAGPTAAESRPAPAFDRKKPFPSEILEVTRLNGPGSEKDVRHVALALRGSGPSYEAGDALGVCPENCPELVDGVLRMLGATGEEPVAPGDGPSLTAREALARTCAIHTGSGGVLTLLAGWAADPGEASRLRALADDDPHGFLEGRDLLDVLELFPSARGPVAELIASLSPLQPRLYSIASSPKAHPEEVHLTVGVVRYAWEDSPRPRKGVASTFLAERVRRGAAVKVFVQPSHGFRLPARGDTPILMVGPGTGIAPFRAFLQERLAQGATGRNWLFFGDQRRDHDFLYREELEEYRRIGLLTRLDLAFSRDQREKIYVQHRMLESAGQLWAWLQEGAYFYVCGDARRMARDVDQTLHRIVGEQGHLSEDAARSYVADLKRAKRYQRDVY